MARHLRLKDGDNYCNSRECEDARADLSVLKKARIASKATSKSIWYIDK